VRGRHRGRRFYGGERLGSAGAAGAGAVAMPFSTAASRSNRLSILRTCVAPRRRLRHYVNPTLLVIDEVGYLSHSNRHADLLFELISRRYEPW
jgi:DNA replication protein DnaC